MQLDPLQINFDLEFAYRAQSGSHIPAPRVFDPEAVQEKDYIEPAADFQGGKREREVICYFGGAFFREIFHCPGLQDQQGRIRDKKDCRAQQLYQHGVFDKIGEFVVFYWLLFFDMLPAVKEDVRGLYWRQKVLLKKISRGTETEVRADRGEPLRGGGGHPEASNGVERGELKSCQKNLFQFCDIIHFYYKETVLTLI